MSKMKPWKTDFCFVDVDAPERLKSRCRICNHLIESGVFVVFSLPTNGYYSSGFRVHPDCLIETGERAKKVDPNSYVDPIAEKKARRAVDMKVCLARAAEIREKADFNKSLVKEALKRVNLKVSKISIRRLGQLHVSHGVVRMSVEDYKWFRLRGSKDAYGVQVKFEGSEVVVSPEVSWASEYYSKGASKRQVVQLADPDGLTQLGEAIMRLDNGHFAQHLKKKR